MKQSRYFLSAMALFGAVASPMSSASHSLHSRPQAAPAPAQHAAVSHTVPDRAVGTLVARTRMDVRPVASPPRAAVRYALPAIRVAAIYPVVVPQRIVAVPVPYYVAAGAQPVQEAVATPSAGFPPDWNWRPVESFAALAPRANALSPPPEQQLRYYCPDTREYFPSVETCNSSWLKVIP